MLDGRVQLFQTEEFQSQRPPLAPALTLAPCRGDANGGAGFDVPPATARLPVDFLQWSTDGDLLVAISEDDGCWRIGGWHLLQNAVGDLSALAASGLLLKQMVSPAELARMAAVRANPRDAASLAHGRGRREELTRSSGSLSILGDVHPPAFSDSFEHVALATRVASATILEDPPASPQLLSTEEASVADGGLDEPSSLALSPHNSGLDPGSGSASTDSARSCPSSPSVRPGAGARNRPSSRRGSGGRPSSAPGSATGLSRQTSAPPLLRKRAHQTAGRNYDQSAAPFVPQQQQHQYQQLARRPQRSESVGAILEPGPSGMMQPIFQPVIYVPVHLANAAFMAQQSAFDVSSCTLTLPQRIAAVFVTRKCRSMCHVRWTAVFFYSRAPHTDRCRQGPLGTTRQDVDPGGCSRDPSRAAAGAAAHMMQPFSGTQHALFQPMPAGPWPQQMFTNFGSPSGGPPMQTPMQPQPPPPPPVQPQPPPPAEPRRGLRLTPTSPLSPAPSYRKGGRSDGERSDPEVTLLSPVSSAGARCAPLFGQAPCCSPPETVCDAIPGCFAINSNLMARSH